MSPTERIIPYIDMISLLALLIAAYNFARGTMVQLGSRVKAVVWVICALLMFNSFSNTLEWLHITSALDTLEDYSGLFLPIFFFFSIFIFLEELGQKEVTHLRNYLANVVDSMPSVLVGVDPEGRVTQWNATAARVTGLRPQDAQGKSLPDVYPSLAHHMQSLKEAIAQSQVFSDSRMSRVDEGEVHYEDLTIYPLVENGVQGAVIRLDDVTERARIEEMMVQTEKMMSVGGLAAGMAHEINNPIGIILLSVQNILRRISPDLPANESVARECGVTLTALEAYLRRRGVVEFLEDIRLEGARASEIIENMLQFSRRSESSLVPTDVQEVVTSAIALAGNDYDLKKRYDFRHIDVDVQCGEGLTRVPMARTEMEQVLLNLFKNGAHAMCVPPTGVTAHQRRSPRFRISAEREGNWAVIAVSDNGPGIDEESRKRVFEPFYTTKPVGEGTGLGLSVSYMIVTVHHKGEMRVVSAPGEGATFIIKLPLGHDAGCDQQAPSTTPGGQPVE